MQVQILGNAAAPTAFNRLTCARSQSKSLSEFASWLQGQDRGPFLGCDSCTNSLHANPLWNYEELNRLHSLRRMSFLFFDSHSVETSTWVKLYSCKQYIFIRDNYFKKVEPSNEFKTLNNNLIEDFSSITEIRPIIMVLKLRICINVSVWKNKSPE